MARKASTERAKVAVGGFATAKKNIVIQFRNSERTEAEILAKIRTDVSKYGIPESEIQSVDVYIKPEEHRIFYVVNKEINGNVEF